MSSDARKPDQDRSEDREAQEAATGVPGAAGSNTAEPGDRDSERSRRAIAAGLAAASAGMLAAGAGISPQAGERAQAGNAAAGILKAAEEAPAPTAEWDIEVTRNDRVDFFIEFLMGKNHDKTRLWLERIGTYGPLIGQKLADHGMPQDLLYLAMIESGLDPNAYSKADAAGLWQFIEETGERYGLEVTTYVDERRDPVKATDAALTYLKEMHDRFGGSWYLAAAGYNTGENRVERVLNEQVGDQRGEESLFWEIMDELPRETRDYVPVMLAMGHIAKDPAKYGFEGIEPMAPLAYDEVKVPGATPLSEVAQAAGVDEQVVLDLNPHLLKKQTPPDRDWDVRVPVDSGQRVAAAFGAGAGQGAQFGD